ncbi:AAA family ATPase [Leptospira ilyithenensis]|uniref:AAA family ATPase n=1 Tax=Leptospira ilyithenensis TaxID=2484901 RepID=A0A4R9LUY2_9LEPT|nr:AAA family ATPase [Leptospira ilyithenensis]TGN13107.1 AAA family ATPase [Leptospira ilyithenensis]
MIKKIKQIKDTAVFKNFDWKSTLIDKQNKEYSFRRLNLIYGRNYSGKTTLSRIFRSFETGLLPEKNQNAKFNLETLSGTDLSESNIYNHNLKIRVYNKEYVKHNLKFIFDNDGDILPFAIVGSDNVDIEEKIKHIKIELGNIEKKAGLLYDEHQKRELFNSKNKEHGEKQENLVTKLRNKARLIKENASRYENVNYRINNIDSDIDLIQKNPTQYLSLDLIKNHEAALLDTEKADLLKIHISLDFIDSILEKSKILVETVVTQANPIARFSENPGLENWAKTGIQLHKDKLSECGFCGQNLPSNLWDQYKNHFNEDSEIQINEINSLITEISIHESNLVKFKLPIKDSFYTLFIEDFQKFSQSLELEIKTIHNQLSLIRASLEEKKIKIFSKLEFPNITFNKDTIPEIQTNINELVKKNNERTKRITEEKKIAREFLRLNEVSKFLLDIDYQKEKEIIESLNKEKQDAEISHKTISLLINEKNTNIELLEKQLKDEQKGADKVNEYLNNFFGNNSLKLVHVEGENISCFNVMRGSEKAFNLSEGECSLISFCYFMAKLTETPETINDLIIWIDDPISSLDNNHIFFVFSLIESRIALNKKYGQLFISTHNLDFLKYLKKMTLPTYSFSAKNGTTQTESDVSYFLIERNENESKLKIMPKYLRKYTTEFNYLFDQIYKCANQNPDELDYNIFYGFGNNLRKFLEAYLFYKYPNNTNILVKLKKFFHGDDTTAALINRVDNELSHLEEIFDRSMRPIEIPEIPKIATYVLNKLKEKDPEQYDALVKSIDGK